MSVTKCPDCGKLIALIFPLHECKTEKETTPKVIYRVVMLNPKTGRWDLWTNYATYDDAELAACGLVSGGKSVECQILEIGVSGGRIIAKVGAKPTPGFPHGQAVVKRQGDINAPVK